MSKAKILGQDSESHLVLLNLKDYTDSFAIPFNVKKDARQPSELDIENGLVRHLTDTTKSDDDA